MSTLRLVALALLVACGTPEPPAADPADPGPAPGSDAAFVSVREALDAVRAAQQVGPLPAVEAAWTVAYRERFEPLVETPLRGQVPAEDLVAAEYAFGRLLAGIQVISDRAVEDALRDLEARLATLEAARTAPEPPAAPPPASAGAEPPSPAPAVPPGS